MENKYNIDDVNAWLKEQYGMSYDDLSKEFNKAVDLLSESLKQRKEMRNKINTVIEFIETNQIQNEYTDRGGFRVKENKFWLEDSDILLDILKEDK